MSWMHLWYCIVETERGRKAKLFSLSLSHVKDVMLLKMSNGNLQMKALVHIWSICPFCSMHNGCALKDYGILKTQRREFESSPQVGRLNASLTFQWLLKGFSVLAEFGEDNKQIKPWNRGLLLERSTGHTVSLTQGWQIFVLANTESEETLNCFLMLINSQFTIRICERSITKYRSLFSFSFEHHRMTQVGLDKVLAFVSTLLLN